MRLNVIHLAFHQTDHAQYINNISLHFLVIDSTGEDIEEMDEEEKVDTLPVTSSDNLVKKVRTYYVYKIVYSHCCFAFIISQRMSLKKLPIANSTKFL